MRELAATIGEATGYRGAIRWDASRPNGQPRRMLDVERARERFGFEARTSLRRGPAPHHRLVPSASARPSRPRGRLPGSFTAQCLPLPRSPQASP
jgi:hypothetical protein